VGEIKNIFVNRWKESHELFPKNGADK